MVSLQVQLPSSQFRALERRAASQGVSVEVLIERGLLLLMQPTTCAPRAPAPRARRRNDFAPRMTAAQAKRQRKQLEREISEGHKRADLAKLAELRKKIGEARKSSKPRRADALELCRIGRTMAKERAKVLRIEGREAIRKAIEEEKIAAREACDARKAQVRADVKTDVARARAELKEEKAFQREIRNIESRARRRERPKSTAKERRAESDDQVRANIPPDLVPLFERVKRQIKGSDRLSRTEAFLQYAEENPSEILDVIEEQTAAEIRKMQKEEEAQHRRLRRRGVSAAELAAVPF